MAMMHPDLNLPANLVDPQPEPQPAEAVAPPQDSSHTPLIQRVIALEDRLTELVGHHNSFVNDVVREIGL